jgi:hypothetical protein
MNQIRFLLISLAKIEKFSLEEIKSVYAFLALTTSEAFSTFPQELITIICTTLIRCFDPPLETSYQHQDKTVCLVSPPFAHLHRTNHKLWHTVENTTGFVVLLSILDFLNPNTVQDTINFIALACNSFWTQYTEYFVVLLTNRTAFNRLQLEQLQKMMKEVFPELRAETEGDIHEVFQLFLRNTIRSGCPSHKNLDFHFLEASDAEDVKGSWERVMRDVVRSMYYLSD